jgi:hypothetical protein
VIHNKSTTKTAPGEIINGTTIKRQTSVSSLIASATGQLVITENFIPPNLVLSRSRNETQNYHQTGNRIMAASAADDHDEQQAAVLFGPLEHVVRINQQALELLQNGDEAIATSVLTGALTVLALIARYGEDELDALDWAGDGHPADGLPYGITISRLPNIREVSRARESPCLVLGVTDNGTFSRHHGLGNAQQILSGITLFHMALAIHRGCCRGNAVNRRQVARAWAFYQMADTVFAQVPQLSPVRHIIDTSVGLLCALFDYPVAA